LDAGADILLLDNVPVGRLKGLVQWIRAECRKTKQRVPLIEVSGGITPERVSRVARTGLARAGIDRISIGRLTHSAPALDMSLDVTPL
jgi:nicotinate-nucleotide pyrophosphorylase (carboxylating)